MISFKDYFLVQLKRILKILPGTIVMLAIFAVLCGTIAYALINNESILAEHQRYKLGVVGDTSDDMLTMGIELLENNDDSRFMLEIVRLNDESKAKAALREGAISAYVLVNDDFINSLNALSNDMSLEYFATSGQRGITNVMMDEIADIASNLVVNSEKGLLSLRKQMEDAGYPAEVINGNTNELLALYIGAMLARTDMAEIKDLGLSDGLSTEQYYSISLSLFFLLLMSFCGVSLFLDDKKATHKFVSAKGLGAVRQILAEFLAYFLMNLFCVEVILFCVRRLSNIGAISSESAEMIGDSLFIKSEINIIPTIILFSALGFLIFEAISGVINKCLAAFFFTQAWHTFPDTFIRSLFSQMHFRG